MPKDMHKGSYKGNSSSNSAKGGASAFGFSHTSKVSGTDKAIPIQKSGAKISGKTVVK